MTAGLIMDGIVTVLLLATLAFCFILNRKIGSLRRTSAEMTKLISGFDASIEKARASVEALKQTAGESGAELQEKLNAATALRDELAFLSDSTETAKNGQTVALGPVAHNAEADFAAADTMDLVDEAEADDAPRSESERELVQALRQVR